METNRKKQIREWAKSLPAFFASCGIPDSMNMAKDLVELLKITPDVVRCKDCKFYPNGEGTTTWTPCKEIITPPNWFCADGERRTDDA